jgi:chromosome segregation ATPase
MPQNELEKTLGKVIDQKVTPEFKKVNERLVKIESKLTDHDEKLEKIQTRLDATFEAVGETKVDVTEVQEDISDLAYTAERIESRLNTVVNDQDNMSLKTRQLNRRVLKLEAKKA